jgi:hypothetical protein
MRGNAHELRPDHQLGRSISTVKKDLRPVIACLSDMADVPWIPLQFEERSGLPRSPI